MNAETELKKKFKRKFAFGCLILLLGLGTWTALVNGPPADGIPVALRRVHEWNERVSRFFFRGSRLAPTFDPSRAAEPRLNGNVGLRIDKNFDPLKWRLHLRGNGKSVTLSIGNIQALPRVAMTTELLCIEGWSTVTSWAGATLRSVLEKYDLLTESNRKSGYVGLSTPDREYYVGIEMETALHPQTLLAYEMNGKPLTLGHGAPLRLATPLKYGIKSIKRIGEIIVSDERPADYWAERGYDWYSGH